MRPVAPRVVIVLAVVLGIVALALVTAIGGIAWFMPDCARCHMTGAFKVATLAHRSHSRFACDQCHGGTSVHSRVQFGTVTVFGMYLQVVPVDPTFAVVQRVSQAPDRASHGRERSQDPPRHL